MGKIVRNFLILFFIIVSLYANSIEKSIGSLNKKIPFSSQTEVVRIFHNLKNLYINTIISGDKELQKKALEGMIKSAKIVNFDYKRYENELRLLTKSEKDKSKELSVAEIIKVLPEPKIDNNKLVAEVKHIKLKDYTIFLTFNKPIKKNDITFFELNEKRLYKDVYDIKANINSKIPKLTTKSIDKIRIAQNKQDKIRIVLENNRKIISSYVINKNILSIKFKSNKKIAKSTSTIKSKKKSTVKSVYGYKKVIVIDPGHGGKDSGAIGYKGKQEKKAVLNIAKYLKKELLDRGFKVYLTREKDKFIKLSKRTKFANNKEADLFISIHGNAAPKKHYLSLKGIETFFLSPARTSRAERIAAKENESVISKMGDISKNAFVHMLNRKKIVQSHKLAIDIQAGMLSKVRKKYKDVIDGGVREAPFWVLVGAQMPAILVEVGYLTNPKESERLFNPFYQRRLASGMASGINDYFYRNR